MGDGVKIKGDKLLELFANLVEKKVIISMHVVGAGIDRLTCITGLTQTPQGNHLLIDPPKDLKADPEADKAWHLRFNFNGPDKLEYLFSTRGGILIERGLKIPFPKYVERLQRRRYFRVDTPTGSELHFRMKRIKGILHMINISEGGVYGVLVKHNFKFLRGSLLKMKQHLDDVRMIFPLGDEAPDETVAIKKADVVRIEHDRERGFYRYALEFKDMEKEARDRLIQVIYALQRMYLRRRK